MADEILIRMGRTSVGNNIFEIGPGDADGRFVIGNDVNSTDRLDFGYDDASSVFFDQTSGNDANAGTRVSPYETPWRAFQDIDNSTKFVAVQLDTTDVDIGTVPYRIQTDKNLAASSNLVPSLDGIHNANLPNSCTNIIEGIDQKLILSGSGNILVSNNAGVSFQSIANTSGQNQDYGDYIRNETGAAEDWVILAPSGEDDTTAIFMVSDDGGKSFTGYNAAGLGLGFTFDEILFVICGSDDFAQTPTTTWMGYRRGADYGVFTNTGVVSPIGSGGWSDITLLTTSAWFDTTANNPYLSAPSEREVALTADATIWKIGFASVVDENPASLPPGWGGVPYGCARNSNGFLVGSSGAWLFNLGPDATTIGWTAVTAPPITPLGVKASDNNFYVWDATSIYVSSDNASTWSQVNNVDGFAGIASGAAAIRSAEVLSILNASDLFIFSDGTKTINYGGVSGYDFGSDFINCGPVYGCSNSASFEYVDGEINQSAILSFSQLGRTETAQIYQSEFTNNLEIIGADSSNVIIQRNQIQEYVISANQATITDNLALNNGTITKLADDTNTIAIQNNTIIGTLDLNNDAITTPANGFGFIYADNLNENSLSGSNPSNLISITSGNIRGSVSTISTLNAVSENPFFANTTDYQLQYVVNGFNFNSPFINSSVLSVTSTSGQRRAFGAWSFDTSAVTTGYTIARRLPFPNRNDGSAINWTWKNISNLQIPEGGQPDVFNNITKQTEELTLNYASLKREDIDAINYFISNFEDMTVELILNPDLVGTFPASITANGAQPAGTPVVNVTTAGSILPGYYVEFGGNSYQVLYPNPLGGVTTSIVLDRVTQTDLADTDTITVKAPLEFSEWQFVPGNNMSLMGTIPELVRNNIESQFTSSNSLWNGLKLVFIRKRNG